MFVIALMLTLIELERRKNGVNVYQFYPLILFFHVLEMAEANRGRGRGIAMGRGAQLLAAIAASKQR